MPITEINVFHTIRFSVQSFIFKLTSVMLSDYRRTDVVVYSDYNKNVLRVQIIYAHCTLHIESFLSVNKMFCYFCYYCRESLRTHFRKLNLRDQNQVCTMFKKSWPILYSNRSYIEAFRQFMLYGLNFFLSSYLLT